MNKPAISAIKQAQPADSYYFSRGTMRHFGQRLSSFKVHRARRLDTGAAGWVIEAPKHPDGGRYDFGGFSRAFINLDTLKIEFPIVSTNLKTVEFPIERRDHK